MYGTIQGWASYVEERGVTDLTVDATQTPALVRATDYIKYHYVENFRAGFDDTLPEVELATYEAACIEYKKPHFFTKQMTSADAKVLVAVESIRWEKTAASRSDNPDHSLMMPISLKIDSYLRRYMRSRKSSGLFSIGPK